MKKIFMPLVFAFMLSLVLVACQQPSEKEKSPKLSVTIGYDEDIKEEIFADMTEEDVQKLLFTMTEKLGNQINQAKGEEEIQAAIAQVEEDLNRETKEPAKKGTRRFFILVRKEGKNYANQQIVTQTVEQ